MPHPGPPPEASAEALADHLLAAYLRHVSLTEAVCRRFSIHCLFVVQPVPFYRYDRADDPVADRRDFPLFGLVYPRLAAAAEGRDEMLYLGDELATWRGAAPFVDGFHYTGPFHRHLARRIADRLAAGLEVAPVETTR